VDAAGGGVNGSAQIGTVKVGGDWTASSLASGATSGNGIIGGSTAGKIANIVITGQVLGRAETDETFGFFAHEIGAFKSHGLALALRSGACNDYFSPVPGDNRALAVGPSLAPKTSIKPDGFAVHVNEV
jgi:hypothetical protein